MRSVEQAHGEPRALATQAWVRLGQRRDGRAPLWFELAVIGWLFWLYDVINNFAPLRFALATRNAAGVLSVEHWLHLDPELALDRWLAAHGVLATVASYYYFFAHAIVTFALLALLWWRRPDLYIRLRTQLVIVNLIAFVVFWRYPLAPPRMFPALGYRDVIASTHFLLSWDSAALVHDANQLAAMPSLHFAWAGWCGLVIWRMTRNRALRALALAYPAVTSLVVLATGNHYVLDILAGAGTLVLALALDRALRAAIAWAHVRSAQRASGLPAGSLPVHPEHEAAARALREPAEQPVTEPA